MKYTKIHSLAFLTFLFLLVSTGSVVAQTDYVITKDGIKTMGEVKNYSVKKVKFVPVGTKKAQKYNPEQINEMYKAGHGTFRSLSMDKGKRPTFLHVLEDGKIQLYEYLVTSRVQGAPMYNGSNFSSMGTSYNMTSQRWFAQKQGTALIEVKTNSIWGSRKDRKDALSSLIGDNEHVMQRYKTEDRFSFDFVRSLIVEYNKL